MTTASTLSLRDALDDLDRSDLDTDTGRAHALNALDYLDRETGRIRDFITALPDCSEIRCPRCGAVFPWHTADCAARPATQEDSRG